jgi:hypothetical protein
LGHGEEPRLFVRVDGQSSLWTVDLLPNEEFACIDLI